MSLCVAAAVGRAGVGAPLAAVIGLVALDNIQAGARSVWSNEVTATHGGELIEWSGLLAKGYGEIAYTLIDIGLITKASSVVKMATQTENVIKLNTTTAVKVGQTIKPTEVTISIDKISLNQKNVIELKEFNVGKGTNAVKGNDVLPNYKVSDISKIEDPALNTSIIRSYLANYVKKGDVEGISVATGSITVNGKTEYVLAVSGKSWKGNMPTSVNINGVNYKVIVEDSNSVRNYPSSATQTNFNHAEHKLFSYIKDNYAGQKDIC